MSGRTALAALLFAALALPARSDTLTYLNSRFGTEIAFPAELFETRLLPPANGDGMKWTSSDGASLTVFASHNVLDATPAGWLRQLVEQHGLDGEVTYSRSRDNWVVVSGTKAGDIFYERYVFGDGIVHGMVLTYPRDAEAKYNPLVGPIANSLAGP